MVAFLIIFWGSKTFECHTDKIEPWHNGTAYVVEKRVGLKQEVAWSIEFIRFVLELKFVSRVTRLCF